MIRNAYLIQVRYRTRTRCGETSFEINLPRGATMEHALEVGRQRVERRKSVTRIDSVRAELVGTYKPSQRGLR
jgi:hypothetical protein